MKSDEIKSQLQNIEASINALADESRRLKVAFLEAKLEESPYTKGEKVLLTVRDRRSEKIEYGFFEGYKFAYGFKFEPVIFKMKQDGAPSKNVWSSWDIIKIEKISK